MYYDLNVVWPGRPAQAAAAPPNKKQKGKQREVPPSATSASSSPLDGLGESERAELEKSTRMAIKLGYKTIAYNVILPLGNFELQTVSDLNPCGRFAQPVFPELDPRTASSSSTSKDGANHKTLLQLSRLTVTLDEHCISGGKGNGSLFTSSNANTIAGYNLIAALPLDMPSFTHVCLNLSSPGPSSIDIITLDLASSPRLPFQLKRGMVLKAIADGAVFEICYGAAMRSASAASSSGSGERPVSKDARRNIIAGARELIRVTNGKGVIISSEVRRCMEMRGPLDLCNFGTILGLKPEQAKNAVSNTARLTVIRGHSNRQTYRGVISNPEVSIAIPSTSAATPVEQEKAAAGEKRKRPANE